MSEFRHKLTDEQRKMSDADLIRSVPAGTGLSVARFWHWDVVARVNAKNQVEYIVTDSSRQGQKPLRVHGPCPKDEAMKWARGEAHLFRALHVHHPDDEPLPQFRAN